MVNETMIQQLEQHPTAAGTVQRYRVRGRVVIVYNNGTIACTCGSTWQAAMNKQPCEEIQLLRAAMGGKR